MRLTKFATGSVRKLSFDNAAYIVAPDDAEYLYCGAAWKKKDGKNFRFNGSEWVLGNPDMYFEREKITIKRVNR